MAADRDTPDVVLEDVTEYASTVSLDVRLAAPTEEVATRRLAYIRTALHRGLSRLSDAGYLEDGFTVTFSDPEPMRELPPRRPPD